MIFGIGTDIVEINRIAKVVDRYGEHFINYILTDGEGQEAVRRSDRIQFIAGRWAAKEAVAKALGCGLGAQCAWRDIEIHSASSGAPSIVLHGRGRETMRKNEIEHIFVSISHERGFAIATAIAEKNV